MRRRGFTLVELLVVIGIIAVLISMLLPALNKAQYQAKKIQCASNLRQFSIALQQYAGLYGGVLPLGHHWNHDLGNLFGGGATAPANDLGVLYVSGIVNSTQAFYCPLQTNPILQYGTTQLTGSGTGAWDNIWPPPAGEWRQCYLGYTVRPLGDIVPMMVAAAGQTGPILNAGTANTYIYPPNAGSMSWNPSTNPWTPFYPKASQLPGNTAIAADMIDPNTAQYSQNQTILNTPQYDHMLDGNNVAYADGSVQFVPYKIFKSNQQRFQQSFSPTSGGTMAYLLSNMNNLNNPTPLTGVWADYDNYDK